VDNSDGISYLKENDGGIENLAYDAGYEKCAHLYDLFDTKENVEFFLWYATEAGEVLDIGAGTGRIAIPLAEKGIKVFCVEPSAGMRAQFKKKLSALPELAKNIKLVAGDAKSFNFDRTFPAAFLSGSFDHFMGDQERIDSLRNIARHLQPGGKLVFDVGLGFMNDKELSPAGELKVEDKEYRRFFSRKRIDDKIEWFLIYEIYESGKLIERIEEKSYASAIDRPKLLHLLKKTGFKVKKEFGDWDLKEYKEGDLFLIVEAVKV
jgi:SAM-dependent methyltransferase